MACLQKMIREFDAALWANQRPAGVEGGRETKVLEEIAANNKGIASGGEKKAPKKGKKKK